MAGGGMTIMQSPSGRSMTPEDRIAEHSFAPSASSGGKDSFVGLSLTISTAPINPQWRASPT
jgi:hypothetical protein